MGVDRVKLNLEGFRKIRTSPEMVADLLRRGGQIAAASGAGYRVELASNKNRARVTVFPDTDDAIRDNAQHNSLIHNLDRGR